MSKNLVQFTIKEQRHIPGASGNFTDLLSDTTTCKQIAHSANKGALAGAPGGSSSIDMNISAGTIFSILRCKGGSIRL